MKFILMFLIFAAMYCGYRALGEDVRAEMWKMVRPHILPLAFILIALVAYTFYVLYGGTIALI